MNELIYVVLRDRPRGQRIERLCSAARLRPEPAFRFVVAPRRAALRQLDLTARWARQALLVREAVGWSELEVLRVSFRDVVAGPAIRFLPTRQLLSVMVADDAADRLIGVAVSEAEQSLVLYRGSLDRLAVPMAWFARSGTGVMPDFGDVGVTDDGYTLRLGSYEAAVEAILYELDADFRRRERARRLEMDPSFGAALRRLRLQRGLRREDFAGLSARELARIERGEVGRPHAATLRRIAERLGVTASEIGSY